MQIITIESSAFADIMSKIDAINNRLNEKEKRFEEIWIDNKEFINLLKISARTAQEYRDSGKVSFSQIEKKIFYKISDIESMLMKHYNKAFNNFKK